MIEFEFTANDIPATKQGFGLPCECHTTQVGPRVFLGGATLVSCLP